MFGNCSAGRFEVSRAKIVWQKPLDSVVHAARYRRNDSMQILVFS